MTGHVSFSVVIPLFNKAAYIEACLESVLWQTYPPTEIIVVDDGSSDRGPDLVSKYAGIGVRLVRQKNIGPGPARNIGVSHAKSPWIAFLDADDLWHPDHLRIHYDAIQTHSGAGVVGSAIQRSATPDLALRSLSPQVGHASAVDYIQETAHRLSRATNGSELITSSSVSVHRHLLDVVQGFSEAYPGEDTATWLRLALRAIVVATEQKSAIYRTESGGITERKREFSVERHLSHPLRLALLEALDDDHSVAKKGALCDYLAAVDANALRAALYHEHLCEARKLAEHVVPEATKLLGWAGVLLGLHPSLGNSLVRSFKRVRKHQRSISHWCSQRA